MIGAQRVKYILELRSEDAGIIPFESLNDLHRIGMCSKQIASFKVENIAFAVGVF